MRVVALSCYGVQEEEARSVALSCCGVQEEEARSVALSCCGVQEEEARRRQVREVAYDLQRRVKQELAFPAVIHFYSWLLQGKPPSPLPGPPGCHQTGPELMDLQNFNHNSRVCISGGVGCGAALWGI